MAAERKQLVYSIWSEEGQQIKFSFPLHPLTSAPGQVGDILDIVVDALDREVDALGATNGDVIQALAMALARSEAIKSSTSIAVIPETVSPNGWANGWCVAPATVANCDDAAVLRRFSGRSNVAISSAALASPYRILFLRDGTRGVSSGRPRFKVSSPQLPAAGQNARCVLLTQQGRTEVSATTRDANCPQ